MCGFVGYFSNKKINLSPALKSIAYRGPDKKKIVYTKDWSVAFNRLSIIDTSTSAMQPFTYKNVTVFVNGEIYNYVELREKFKKYFTPKTKSDIEIIPYLYSKYGIKFLNMLNGMFSMVIIDNKNNKKILIRDRFGKKPLFYFLDKKDIYFSSEVKALKKIIKTEISKQNIISNIFCWNLIQPLTLYKKVHSIQPGAFVELVQRKKVKFRNWYNPKFKIKKLNLKNIKTNFIRLIRKSVEIRLRSDVPVGVFLSGGLDSSIILKIAKEKTKRKIYAINAVIKNKFESEGNLTDTVVPKKFCKDLKQKLHQVNIDYEYFNKNFIKIVNNSDDLFLDSGPLVHYALAEKAKKIGVKVILTGGGGDEIFGGYYWQARLKSVNKFILKRALRENSFSKISYFFYKILPYSKNKIINKIKNANYLLINPKIWHAMSHGNIFQKFIGKENLYIFKYLENISNKYFNRALKSNPNDVYNAINYANIFTVLSRQNYTSDHGAMMHSIENRSPFLDKDLVEFMMSLPDSIKWKANRKFLLSELLKDELPSYITRAKKSGPSVNLKYLFNSAKLRKKINQFILKNSFLIQKLLSKRLSILINKDISILYANKCIPLFAIISFLIWAKINYEKSISNVNLTFEKLINSNA